MYSVSSFQFEFFSKIASSNAAKAAARQSTFQNLDPLSRRVIRLRHFENFGFAEIGELVSMTENEIRTIWENGVAALRRSFSAG